MSAGIKIMSVKFADWIHKNRYTVYWGSDAPNCEKWYVYGTMPDRDYYTLEELFDIFERDQKLSEQQSNCNLPHVSGSLLLRSDEICLLEKYSLWLTKHGYMDTDWKDEEPFAIDEFLKSNDR